MYEYQLIEKIKQNLEKDNEIIKLKLATGTYKKRQISYYQGIHHSNVKLLEMINKITKGQGNEEN